MSSQQAEPRAEFWHGESLAASTDRDARSFTQGMRRPAARARPRIGCPTCQSRFKSCKSPGDLGRIGTARAWRRPPGGPSCFRRWVVNLCDQHGRPQTGSGPSQPRCRPSPSLSPHPPLPARPQTRSCEINSLAPLAGLLRLYPSTNSPLVHRLIVPALLRPNLACLVCKLHIMVF